MTDTQAAKPATKESAEQEISYLGARLREKSTYGGLAVLVGLVLPYLTRLDPGLAHTSVNTIVTAISDLGIGIGLFIGIVLPEKGSNALLAWLTAGLAAALTFGLPHAAQAGARVPLPKPRPVYDLVAPKKPSVAQAQQNPLLVLQQFTVADLQAALADAQAQTPPDTTAASCYQALIPFVQQQTQNPLPQGAGIFQALQKARDAKAYLANIQSPTGPLAGLNQACAPLVLDVQNTLLTLGVSVGVIANPASASAALAGLPAAIAAFLNLPKP